jgi:alpha-beta hydrolase superfamily lysophospholipase
VTLAFGAHAKTGLARAAGDLRGVRHAGVVGTLGLLVALTFAVVTTLDVAADHWRQPLVVVVASVGLLGLVAFLALLKGPAAAPVPAVVAVGPTVNRRGV